MYAKMLRFFLAFSIILTPIGCGNAETKADQDKQFAESLNEIKAMVENGEVQSALVRLGKLIAANEVLSNKIKSYASRIKSITETPGSQAYRARLLESPLPSLSKDEMRAIYLFPVLMLAQRTPANSCPSLPMLYLGALKGYALAQYLVGGILSQGEVCGWPRDLNESVHWYARAGEQGHRDAQINHAIAMLYGIGTQKNFTAGSKLLMANAAEKKIPRAQYLLGKLMAEGRVIKKNEDGALIWLRRAADRGYAPAQVKLGMMLWERASTLAQWDEARHWLRRAAEQGDAEAQFQLAKTHRAGIDGDSWLFKESMKLYEAAAVQGHVEAQTALGLSYWSGDFRTNTMAADYDKAVKWFSKAAERGNAVAQTYLGYAYNDGKGVARNPGAAVKWWRKGAAQNYALAEEAMGWAYENGRGVFKNLRMARKWYSRSKSHGSWSAANRLKESQFEKLAKQDATMAIFLGLIAIGVLTAGSHGGISEEVPCGLPLGCTAGDIAVNGFMAGLW
jgi:uncharacterized protein